MLTYFRPAFLMLLIMTLLTGLAYPLAMTGIGQLAFSNQANGSAVVVNEKVIGSSLIGQAWSSDKYFWGRPSAAGDKGYDASGSSGSNLGPTSKALMDRIAGDVTKLQSANGVETLPADAVTASGSGLDPHISPSFAYLQIARVAKARNMTEDQVKSILAAHIEKPALGVFGENLVNVLLLNSALDALSSTPNG
jgi:potassium-transporting ATPase KdpC subunit